MQNHMHMIAHDGKCIYASREYVAQFQNARFQPSFAMFKIFAAVVIASTQPRPTHAAADQMEKLRLSGVDKLAARLGHGRILDSLALRQYPAELRVASDLSQGWGCLHFACAHMRSVDSLGGSLISARLLP